MRENFSMIVVQNFGGTTTPSAPPWPRSLAQINRSEQITVTFDVMKNFISLNWLLLVTEPLTNKIFVVEKITANKCRFTR